jgi:hypothetical protein
MENLGVTHLHTPNPPNLDIISNQVSKNHFSINPSIKQRRETKQIKKNCRIFAYKNKCVQLRLPLHEVEACLLQNCLLHHHCLLIRLTFFIFIISESFYFLLSITEFLWEYLQSMDGLFSFIFNVLTSISCMRCVNLWNNNFIKKYILKFMLFLTPYMCEHTSTLSAHAVCVLKI